MSVITLDFDTPYSCSLIIWGMFVCILVPYYSLSSQQL